MFALRQEVVSLGVSANAITSLAGVENAPLLRFLDVSENALASIAEIQALPRLSLVNALGNPLIAPDMCPHPTARCVLLEASNH